MKRSAPLKRKTPLRALKPKVGEVVAIAAKDRRALWLQVTSVEESKRSDGSVKALKIRGTRFDPRRTKKLKPIGARGLRLREEDAKWKQRVHERDGFKCVLCPVFWHPQPSHRLDAHHIYSKQAHPRLRHEVCNGATLCRAHHQWVHHHVARGRVALCSIIGNPDNVRPDVTQP